MDDLLLSIAPVSERVTVTVQPPPPGCTALTTSAAPSERIHLYALQNTARIHLRTGPQIAVPGAACLPLSHSNPVFAYEGTRLVRATFGDGFVREFSYDSGGRLAQVRDVQGGFTRIRTLHYDADGLLLSIT